MSKQVLCFPAKLLDKLPEFDKLTTSGYAIKKFFDEICTEDNLCWINRDKAEEDPSYLQVIPYCCVLNENYVFRYQRTKKGGEDRLHDKYSVGVGGHIEPIDGNKLGIPLLRETIKRELFEEMGVDGGIMQEVALLFDPSEPVGLVHFGIVYYVYVDLRCFNFSYEKDAAIANGRFVPVADVIKNPGLFENWSKIVVEQLLKKDERYELCIRKG